VTIGNDVSSIGAYAFYDCTNLVNVAGGDGIDGIGPYAFFGCIGLSSVPIGSNVSTIEGYAFSSCAALTNVTIPRSLTNIGRGAFADCIRLTSITVEALNPIYCSVDGVLFNGDQTRIVLYPGGKVGSYTVPATVTNIGDFAFASCHSLTNVTMGNHVTIMGSEAFFLSTNLTGVYFYGDAPDIPNGLTVFSGADRAIVYYLPGKAGWDQFFGGCRTALWRPQVLASDASFGVPTNQFGFNINWASNMTVIVDASTVLSNPLWVPVRTNTLTDGFSYFSDPDWTNYPCRFYRVRSQ
jgi:hypothetical protein